MNPSGRSGRLKFFIGILAAIVLLHIIVLALIVNSSNAEKTPANKKTEALPEPSAKEVKPVVKKPVLRYRRPSKNPYFGKPLNYKGARHGSLNHIVPGDTATAGIIVDMNTRRVLWEKNSSRPVPVASMSKMMTLLLAMEHLENHPELSLQSPIKISREVLTVPRSGVIWLDPRETFSYEDLIKCAAIKSANDAAFQLALAVSGSEARFVSLMNQKAKALNMNRTTFINSHGLPAQNGNSLSTAHDMVLLGERLLEYPFLMTCCATSSSSIRTGDRKTVYRNSNNLIRRKFRGMEGMKTGFTRKAGFCLTFCVTRDGRRLMGCVTGFSTSKERDTFCENLIEWAFKGCPDTPVKQRVVKSAVRKKVRSGKHVRR
ncbi:MAG: D-alanyl-D-alanine carboxypeptidase [Lentisphaeria bacterium]|nr:D-alanyl-D-alanine carboxypeptidase [Lentisphaeria bacterium]